MVVTGCGKTSLDTAFSERLNISFPNSDDFHPAGNI